MAANALEEKINKIRQQNEEIRRRHEEVEEDKKNAAKLNALVQMVPSTDWPERKEPPEFSNPPRINNKPKHTKEHHEHPQQHHSISGEGRKVHTFAQGQGPPPDPKYNFLADSEREEGNMESTKDTPSNRGQKNPRGTFRRKTGGRDGIQRDYRMNKGPHRDEHQPEYEAWRAERNRIDEDRISRQRTAEGNWRREWDNDKAHIVDEMARSEAKLGDYVKKDHKDFDRRYHVNGSDYAHHNRGHRSYRGNSRHFYNNYENRSNNTHQDGYIKNPLSPGIDERTVIATDKSIKVTLNQGNIMKGPVMSVKVNSPSIAGTGRVGPRQRSRITYSSHSDVEVTSAETDSFSRPKSFEDKTKDIYHDNLQRSPNTRKSQPIPRKKDMGNKSPYFHKKEIRKEDDKNSQKHHGTDIKLIHARKEYKEPQRTYQVNPRKFDENDAKPSQNNDIANVKESNIIAFDESDTKNIELKSKDDQNNDLNTHEDCTKIENESVLQSSNPVVSKTETEIEAADETQFVQTDSLFECEAINTDLSTSLITDDDDKNETKPTINPSCDNNDTENIIKEDITQDSLTHIQETTEIMNDTCIGEQSDDKSEKEDKIIVTSLISYSEIEENNKSENNNQLLKEEEIPVQKKEVAENETALTSEKIDTIDKQDIMICANEKQESIGDSNDEKENNIASSIVVDKLKSTDENLQVEEEKVIPDEVDATEK